MADHREVERLFDVLKNEPDKRQLTVPVLTGLLVAHSRAEEAEVYPIASSEAGEADEVEHSQEEHVEAEVLLEKLAAADPHTAGFDQILEKVTDAVKHHVEEEESSVLPGMRSKLSDDRRSQLGKAFAASRAAHLGEHPGQATRDELYQQAKNADLPGRSSKSKEQLKEGLQDQS
jgi:hemerythrin superfamily protein